ncbi:hypothetical protein MTR67_044284 [Solanum verrucosum]|uniref:Uncharacterized protein n=1 Tax=Solanum verrucosum TaxID=315347 RepID=A0AAF0ZVY5_SOLVR|nr:hypothetical protein MTR67_044284 [Solanum verrucosum]
MQTWRLTFNANFMIEAQSSSKILVLSTLSCIIHATSLDGGIVKMLIYDPSTLFRD